MGRIETVPTAGLAGVLGRVLTPAGEAAPASRAQVSSFVSYMSVCRLEWTAFCLRRQERETALLFVLILPGNTALLMFPAPETPETVPADQLRLLRAGLEQLAARGLYYVQALVEPQASGKSELLRRSGFEHLTQLIYLQRGTRFPRFDPPRAAEATWLTYDAQQHAAFAQTLLATYQDSQDCPELTGLRPVEAVIAGHKAAGEFDPALWEIACVAGEHAGCVLLSRLAHRPLLEVVYLGVVRGWRRRGVGTLLLRRALEQCRRLGARELVAVVDRRNAAARQLYARFGFKPTAEREAYICRC